MGVGRVKWKEKWDRINRNLDLDKESSAKKLKVLAFILIFEKFVLITESKSEVGESEKVSERKFRKRATKSCGKHKKCIQKVKVVITKSGPWSQKSLKTSTSLTTLTHSVSRSIFFLFYLFFRNKSNPHSLPYIITTDT